MNFCTKTGIVDHEFQPGSTCSFIGALIGAAGSIIPAVIGANAAGDASSQQQTAGQAGIQQLASGRDGAVGTYAPFLGSGRNALANLDYLLGVRGGPSLHEGFNPQGMGIREGSLITPFTAQKFQSSPGYQFQKDQGISAIQNSAVAGGGVTGNTLRELMKFGTGLANQDYYNAYGTYNADQTNVFNRLFGLSQQGGNAATGTANAALGVGSEIAGITQGIGNAQGAGTIGSANNLAGGVAGLTQPGGSLQQLMALIGGSGGGSNPFNPGGASSNFGMAQSFPGFDFAQAG